MLAPRFVATVSVVSLLVLFVAERDATAPGSSQKSQQQMKAAQDRERCPNEPRKQGEDWVHQRDDLNILLARRTQHIPEYHDCQKLLVRGDRGLEYGPLVGIWARDNLDAIAKDSFRLKPVAVAELYNFSQTVYAPLRIEPGYSCLYLQGGQGQWRAFLKQLGPQNPICPDGSTISAGTAMGLEVRVQPNSSSRPTAARWDLDPTRDIQYMGIWCPDGWCEIGARGFKSSPVRTGATPQETVKGWYDEQYLAVIDGGVLRPSTIRGRTVPVKGLGQMTLATFDCGNNCVGKAGWVKVATIYIERDSADYYYNKLNLVDRDVPNHLFLRYNSAKQIWNAQIRNPRRIAFRTMIRIDHGNIPIPGTSRWHFMGMDETVWVRCSDGCCDVTGLQ